EDGIRDFHVTGVQTCALPIFTRELPAGEIARRLNAVLPTGLVVMGVLPLPLKTPSLMSLIDRFTYLFFFTLPPAEAAGWNREKRSEERRVGKGCRSRWLA